MENISEQQMRYASAESTVSSGSALSSPKARTISYEMSSSSARRSFGNSRFSTRPQLAIDLISFELTLFAKDFEHPYEVFGTGTFHNSC